MLASLRGSAFGITCAVALATGTVGTLSRPASAELSPERLGLRCRSGAAGAVRFLTDTGLSLIESCIRKSGTTPPPAECAVLDDSVVGTPYARAETRAQAKLEFMCQKFPDNPARANFPGGDSLLLIPEVKALLEAWGRSTVATAAALSQGEPRTIRRCKRAIAEPSSMIVRSILGRSTGCQKRLDKQGGPLGALSGSCAASADRATRRANDMIERSCGDALAQGLATAICTPFPGCDTEGDTTTGQQLAAAAYHVTERAEEPSRCGDGVVDSDLREVCDDGNTIATDSCTDVCGQAVCGDGILWDGKETCDDRNSVDDDCCSNDCQTAARCGDGIAQSGCQEECDDPNDPGCRDCRFVPFTCDGSGLIATIRIRSDMPTDVAFGAPSGGWAGAGLRLYYPQTLGILTVEGSPVIDESRLRSLQGAEATVLGIIEDGNGDGAEDARLYWARAGNKGFDPVSDLFEVQFDCPQATEIQTRDLSCSVFELSDPNGNLRNPPGLAQGVPCVISSTRLVSAGP